MNVEQFRNVRGLKPFRPYSIRTAGGDRYPVKHPDSVWQSPGGHTVAVGVKGETVALIDIDQITECVFLTKRTPKRAE